MIDFVDRVPAAGKENKKKITYSDGRTETVTIVADDGGNSGTSINRVTLMAIQGMTPSTTVFNDDGTIVTQRHKHIGAGQATNILDELANQHHHHICGEQAADNTADGIQNKTHSGHISLAEFLGQGPHRKNTDTHGDSADDREQGLGDAIIVSTQHIIAEIR